MQKGEFVQNHEVVILGLPLARTAVEYVFRLRSESEDGQIVEDRGFFTKDSVVAGNIPEIVISNYDPEQAYNGWTLFDFQPVGPPDEEQRSGYGALIVDMQGQVMWNSPEGYDEMLDNGNLLVLSGEEVGEITLAGDVVWRMEFQDEGVAHHDADKVWDEEAREDRVIVVQTELYTLPQPVDGIVKMEVDAVKEYNLTGDVIWSWRGLDHPEYIPYDRVDPTKLMRDPRNPAVVDFTHTNAVTLDKDRGYCYFNAKYLNAFFKVRYDPGNPYADGTMKWILGDYPSYVDEVYEGALPLPFVEVENGSVPNWSHDPEINYFDIGGEEVLHVLFWDNNVGIEEDIDFSSFNYSSPPGPFPWGGGGLSIMQDDEDVKGYFLSLMGNEWVNIQFANIFDDEPPRRSRAVEYRFVSEGLEPMAKQIWEFDGSPNYFAIHSGAGGDADRLPNGNILISSGYSSYSDGEENRDEDEVYYGEIMEVTREGEIVSQITLPEGLANYKAQRFRW